MGATCWTYFVPYQPDVEQALAELKQQVFESGDFYLREPFWRDMTEADYDNAPEEIREEMIGWLHRMQQLPDPTTIEELSEWNGDNGTHSILDMEDVSEYQVFGTVSPLTKNEYFFLFGTDRPDRATVERVEQELYNLRDDWIGSYVVVYDGGDPAEYCFFGCSGQ